MFAGRRLSCFMARRLAAIVVADVVGFSRLMAADEAGTLTALRERRQTILEPVVKAHGGRVVKLMGDGVLIEFASAVKAVEAALALQDKFAAANESFPEDMRIRLRIGINLGEVVGEGSDIYGDGVNIASRIEALAEPGGLCLSAKVYDEVRGKVETEFEDIGEQALKNIPTPVRVFAVGAGRGSRARHSEPASLPLPGKPSIAVLPFLNMSEDPAHESFADGLTEDLITDLSRNAGLFVIARNSTFAYKGKWVDVRHIARALGVRHVLEGSARRVGGRVRINVQLIDAIDGGHLWAERFDRNLEDIFAVQDEVTAKIVDALVGRLTAPPARVRPKSLEAYDLCVRARILMEESPQSAREAKLLLRRAIDLDPDYAEAHRWLAMNLWLSWSHWGEPMEPNRRIALTTAERAVALDPNDAGSYCVLGNVLGYERHWSGADAAFATALSLDPNCAEAWAHLSDFTVLSGKVVEGLEQVRKALRLNPHPPGWYYLLLGQALYAARDYVAAIEVLRREVTYRTGSRRFLAASLAQLGRLDEARREAELFLVSNPHFKVAYWVATQPLRDDATCDHFVDGFRKAGFPE